MMESDLLSTGWIKIKDGLFMDMSDKDDNYGKLLKLSHERMTRKEELHKLTYDELEYKLRVRLRKLIKIYNPSISEIELNKFVTDIMNEITKLIECEVYKHERQDESSF